MSTRRIYLEGLKETDENADKKIYAGNNYSGYNRVSIRRKRSLYVKKLFADFFSIIMILGLSTYLTLCHMYVLLKWAFFPLIFIYLMITQYIGKRKQMFRKYVRNIALNLLTNMCSRYIINSARNACS